MKNKKQKSQNEYFKFNNEGRRSGASSQTLNSLIVGTPSELQHKSKNIPVELTKETKTEEQKEEVKTNKIKKNHILNPVDLALSKMVIDENQKYNKLSEYSEQKEDLAQFPELTELMNKIKDKMEKDKKKDETVKNIQSVTGIADVSEINLDEDLENYKQANYRQEIIKQLLEETNNSKNNKEKLDNQEFCDKIYKETHIDLESIIDFMEKNMKAHEAEKKDGKKKPKKTNKSKSKTKKTKRKPTTL